MASIFNNVQNLPKVFRNYQVNSNSSNPSRINNSNNVSIWDINSENNIGDSINIENVRDPQQILDEIKELENKKQENYKQIEKIEQKIEELIKKAEDKVSEAIKKQDEQTKEYENKSKKAVREEISKYVDANKNGMGMTKNELNQNIKVALPDVPELSDSINALMDADGIVSEIDSNVGNLKSIIFDTQELEAQIADLQAEYDYSSQVGYSSGGDGEGGCGADGGGAEDPIGFEFNGNTYDFIVDDGNFDSTSDFLGAKDQWAAMKELDTDGNNIVDVNELQSANIKLVDENGRVQDISKLFGSSFSVDLNSYEANSHNNVFYQGIDSFSDDDNDGIANQKLLGTFNVNINGQTVKGYNTLDDKDWLGKKFGISTSSQESENPINNLNADLQSHFSKADDFEATSIQLKQKIEDGYKNIELSNEQIKTLHDNLSSGSAISYLNDDQNTESNSSENNKKYKEF